MFRITQEVKPRIPGKRGSKPANFGPAVTQYKTYEKIDYVTAYLKLEGTRQAHEQQKYNGGDAEYGDWKVEELDASGTVIATPQFSTVLPMGEEFVWVMRANKQSPASAHPVGQLLNALGGMNVTQGICTWERVR